MGVQGVDVATYEETLDTLSLGSVNRSFDPYLDIDWDNPDFKVSKEDPRWKLRRIIDPLADTDWYKNLPEEEQVRIGLYRQANIAKVGLQFENILIRGMMQHVFRLPNFSKEYRYCVHESKEECNHMLMFQEMVNRIGEDIVGAPKWFRRISPLVPLFSTLTPTVFFMGVLGGEEPIDHLQKSVVRNDSTTIHPIMLSVMTIHIAEEARHISFAHEYIKNSMKSKSKSQRAVLSVVFPVVMRVLHDVIAVPPKSFKEDLAIPDKVFKEAYKTGDRAKEVRRSVFSDVRMLAHDSGLMNPVSKRLWKLMGIDGRVSRYRSEPDWSAV